MVRLRTYRKARNTSLTTFCTQWQWFVVHSSPADPEAAQPPRKQLRDGMSRGGVAGDYSKVAHVWLFVMTTTSGITRITTTVLTWIVAFIAAGIALWGIDRVQNQYIYIYFHFPYLILGTAVFSHKSALVGVVIASERGAIQPE